MEEVPIAIVGGGIAGLSSAVALGHRDVLVLEQAKSFSPVGAGLQLGPNAVRALQKLGAWDAVEPIASSPPEIHMWDAVSGKLLKRLMLGRSFENRFGAPYRVAHRGELHEALLEVAKQKRNIIIKSGQQVDGVDIVSGAALVKTSSQQTLAQHVIATDGVNSALRQMHFPDSAAIDSGETCHRALIDPPKISAVDMDCINIWMYPGAHVVHYRVGKNQLLNIVAITPNGLSPDQHYKGAAPIVREVVTHMDQKTTLWPGLYAPHMTEWAKGPLLLLGDAAHGAMPYLAQGAAMALEDAACIKKTLGITGNLDMDNTFQTIARLRMPRTSRLQRESLAAGRRYHARGVTRLARNAVLNVVPAGALLHRLAWIYGFAL
jgi:salicylate hydroxylase